MGLNGRGVLWVKRVEVEVMSEIEFLGEGRFVLVGWREKVC